jgi:hypothetical protein
MSPVLTDRVDRSACQEQPGRDGFLEGVEFGLCNRADAVTTSDTTAALSWMQYVNSNVGEDHLLFV